MQKFDSGRPRESIPHISPNGFRYGEEYHGAHPLAGISPGRVQIPVTPAKVILHHPIELG